MSKPAPVRDLVLDSPKSVSLAMKVGCGEEAEEAGEAGEIGETTNDQELESNLELLDPDEIEDLNAINRV